MYLTVDTDALVTTIERLSSRERRLDADALTADLDTLPRGDLFRRRDAVWMQFSDLVALATSVKAARLLLTVEQHGPIALTSDEVEARLAAMAAEAHTEVDGASWVDDAQQAERTTAEGIAFTSIHLTHAAERLRDELREARDALALILQALGETPEILLGTYEAARAHLT